MTKNTRAALQRYQRAQRAITIAAANPQLTELQALHRATHAFIEAFAKLHSDERRDLRRELR